MVIYKAFRYRLYPGSKQQILINKTLGCTRYVYNYFLEHCYNMWILDNRWPSYEDCANQLPALKEAYPWLKEVDSISLQQSLRDLRRAYINYVKHRKDGKTSFGKPKYKKKHDSYCKYRTQNVQDNIRMEGNTIKLPILGNVRISKSMDLAGRIIRATVTRTNTGKYYVTLCCKCNVEPLPSSEKETGIDMGIKVFLHTSGGKSEQNPAFLRQGQKRIKQAQRALSRKEKGSNNWKKQKMKLAREHEKVAQKRMDSLHKLSIKVIKENQLIAVESLKVSNMLKNRRLAYAISDVSWSMFMQMLEYKAQWYGRTLVKVDTHYASSQLCSVCGTKNPKLKDISIREWTCPQCGSEHDRDCNAAKNILMEAKRMLKSA